MKKSKIFPKSGGYEKIAKANGESFVDGNMSTFASHEIANKLEKEITELNNIQLTIVHVNPI